MSQEKKEEIESSVSSEKNDGTRPITSESEKNQLSPCSEIKRSQEVPDEKVQTAEQTSLNIGDDIVQTSGTNDNNNRKSVRFFKHVKETLQVTIDFILLMCCFIPMFLIFRLTFRLRGNSGILMLCMISVLVEPLFFYTPVMNDDKNCFKLGKALGIYAVVHRSVNDLIYLLGVILQWPVIYTPQNKIKWDQMSDNLPRQDTPEDETKRWQNKIKGWIFFSFDLFIILPFPQVLVILVLIQRIGGMKFLLAMKFFIGQHVLRVLRLYTLFNKAKTSENHAWWAQLGFILSYVHAGHVIGAVWYFFAVERKIECWSKACMSPSECDNHSFYCDNSSGNYTFAKDFCSTDTQNTSTYNFGIFKDAIDSGIVVEANFFMRFVACFRWGFQNLSYFAQGLTLSTNVLENCFALIITIIGVVLFFFIIGKVQMYVQAESEKSENISRKKREIRRWPLFQRLPEGRQDDIMRCGLHKWPETKSVDVEYFVNNLPDNYIKVNLKWDLCWKLLEKVEEFSNWDSLLMHKLCYHMKPVVYRESSYMVKENAPIDRVVFVLEGNFWPPTSSARTESPIKAQRLQKYLEDGVFWGNEVFDSIKQVRPDSGSSNFETSPVKIQARTKVEAFVLMAEDLKKCYEDHLALQTGRTTVNKIYQDFDKLIRRK